MTQLFFSYLPIILLIFLMTKRKSLPSAQALPLSAAFLYFVALIVFKHDPNLIHAHVLKGLLVAWTPILIITGAVFLFRTMESTGSLIVIRKFLNRISDNAVAQLMLVGWAFPFLIEGASGFGTPAAIAAPILVGLGFPPLRVAILILIMNTIPVSFGAVGTPTWFGFSGVALTEAEVFLIGTRSALLNSVAALIVPFLALAFVVKWKSIYQNSIFILLSILTTVIPYYLVSYISFEFPALVGGATGILLTAVLAKYNVGLSRAKVECREAEATSSILKTDTNTDTKNSQPETTGLIKATFPLWGVILLLIITRIPQLGLRGWLSEGQAALSISLGSLGELGISPALGFSLDNIFLTPLRWQHLLLYIPSLIPFVAIALISLLTYSKGKSEILKITGATYKQMLSPARALLGALVFVELMMMGGDLSAVNSIGKHLAELSGDAWIIFAPLLGALGTFFSGSNTISNLTFAGIQDSIASDLQLDRTLVLALQSVGGAMGNMICINNIVAVASVLALGNVEGLILKQTIKVLIAYWLVVTITVLCL